MIDGGVKNFVLLVFAEVLTAEGDTLTFDVGDGDLVGGYLDGEDGNAAAGTVYCSNQILSTSTTNANMVADDVDNISALMGGKFYAAADTIDIKWIDASTTAKILLSAVIINPYPGTSA